MLSLILLQQIAQLFIIIFLGWAIVKAGILKSEDSRVLSMLLLYVIIPCVILNAFQIERTTDTVRMMELSLLSALMMNVLSLVLGRLSAKLFCLNTVETASVMYSNCTNMVVPLVIGIFGEDWVMYVTCYSIVQTILVWTHARILISGKKEISLRDLVCNVNILAIAIGLFLFAFQIRLPAVIRSAFAMAGNTMGPVAMLIIGMLMADMDMLLSPALEACAAAADRFAGYFGLRCQIQRSGRAGSSRRNTDHHQSALCDRALRQYRAPVQSDVRPGCPLCQSDQHGDHAALHHHDAADDHPVPDVTAQKIATGFI